MFSFEHVNVVQYFGYTASSVLGGGLVVRVAMSLEAHGSLEDYMSRYGKDAVWATPDTGGRLGWDTVSRILEDVCAGVAYLHQHRIVHGDLCDSNVFIGEARPGEVGVRAKIGDFGSQLSLDAGRVGSSSPRLQQLSNSSRAMDTGTGAGGGKQVSKGSSIAAGHSGWCAPELQCGFWRAVSVEADIFRCSGWILIRQLHLNVIGLGPFFFVPH